MKMIDPDDQLLAQFADVLDVALPLGAVLGEREPEADPGAAVSTSAPGGPPRPGTDEASSLSPSTGLHSVRAELHPESLRRVGPDVRAELERLRGLSEGEVGNGALDSEFGRRETSPAAESGLPSESAAHITEARRDANDLLQIGVDIAALTAELDRPMFPPPYIPGREDFIRAYDYRALKYEQLAGLYREKARVLRKINSEGSET